MKEHYISNRQLGIFKTATHLHCSYLAVLNSLGVNTYDSVSQTMVRRPPMILEICPCDRPKYEQIKTQINRVSHYS